MVGLVIVSHSRCLAEAVVDLVRASGATDVPVIGVGGVGEGGSEFGTDGVGILEAIRQVSKPDGALVLMDMGSAVLNAEIAREMLPEDLHASVRICSAPLVEGSVAAAVRIAAGCDLETAAKEASHALEPKREQIGDVMNFPGQRDITEHGPETLRMVFPIGTEHGLHARPAARLAGLAGKSRATVTIRNLSNGKGPVAADSMNRIASLAVRHGDQIEIVASGPDAESVIQAIRRLAAENFGEKAFPVPKPITKDKPKTNEISTVSHYQGVPISAGIAIGTTIQYIPPRLSVPDHLIEDPESEMITLDQALQKALQAMENDADTIRRHTGGESADIFLAHQAILEDPELRGTARRMIFEHRFNAAKAWDLSVTEIERVYLELEDPYLRQRATDVRDAGDRTLSFLCDIRSMEKIHCPHPVILIARDLSPAQTAQLDLKNVLGILLRCGSSTSHSAILARSLGIPAAICPSEDLFELLPDTLLALDGFEGRVWIDPDPEVREILEVRRQEWQKERKRYQLAINQPAITIDGYRVEIAANIGSIEDARLATDCGAESIGLLRTEFLYLSRPAPPEETEQVNALQDIAWAVRGRTLTVRTLDIGGDKPVEFLPRIPEENPFLGVRGLRLSFRNPDLFITQLKAILQAGVQNHLRILFPMVSVTEDLRRALDALNLARRDLQRRRIPHQWPMEIGMMVEIPSAVILAETFAPRVDFFSIGTNDLTQYTFASDRTNPLMNSYGDAMHPAILRQIRTVVNASRSCSKWTSVCGELAGDPLAIPILIGLGVQELSMNADAIPRAKTIIRELKSAAACRLAEEALTVETAVEVRKLARCFLEQRLPDFDLQEKIGRLSSEKSVAA